MRPSIVALLATLLTLHSADAQSTGRVFVTPLNAAGGPGAGGSLVLVEPLGGRFANPSRFALGDGGLASFTTRQAPDAGTNDGRFEVALQIRDSTSAVGGGLAFGGRSALPSGAASGDERVTEHSFELGLGFGARRGPTIGATFAVGTSSLDGDAEDKYRATDISYAVAGAYDVGRFLRVSAVTAPRAIRTQLTRGAREVAVGAEMPAVGIALPVPGLRALNAGTGVEYGRLVSGPAAGDGAVRVGGWLDGVGPIRLRATAERVTGAARWTTDAGVTLAARHVRVGAASARMPDGGPRFTTVSVGVSSERARWR